MTDKIIIMDELLSSKIAAGEVVERPASVVKELMENALDAGAADIQVHVSEGGRRMIRVVDNGEGMGRRDAGLSVVRHATSKLRSDKDLFAIKTMGFRGEALSSIAAVSKLSITTRRAEDVAGTSVVVVGGGAPKIKDAGAPVGTTIEIRDLFFNTPARAKFLRSDGTEFGKISDLFKKIALAHPECGFKLVHGSSSIIDAHAGSLGERISEIFGRPILKELIEIRGDGHLPAPGVEGFIAAPTLSYATAKGIFLYVNRRPVRDSSLARALMDGYGGLIDRGRYPFAVLYITIDPAEVDVNVHPAKTEVRFANPGGLYNLVKTVVNKALATKSSSAVFSPERTTYAAPADARPITLGEPLPAARPAWQARPDPADCFGNRGEWANQNPRPSEASRPLIGALEAVNPEFLEMDVVGQLWGEFLVCERRQGFGKEEEFYVIDQHAAAERTKYERLKAEFRSSSVKSQFLLIPERIETGPEERDALKNLLPVLARLGFDVISFGASTKTGGETFMIKSAPEMIAGRAVAPLIADLLAETVSAGATPRVIDEKLDAIFMRIACHGVMRGKKRLSSEEARALLKDLSSVDFAAFCPHGRPVVKRYTRFEIERSFGRR
jgi:DNA mismatch repair protein MutL